MSGSASGGSVATGVGVSTKDDLVEAVREAAANLKADLADPKLVLCFITCNHPTDHLTEALAALKSALPATIRVGGSVNGIAFGDDRYDAVYGNARAVGIFGFGGEGLRVSAAISANPGGELPPGPEQAMAATEAGKRIAREALEVLGATVKGEAASSAGAILLGAGIGVGLDQPVVNGIRAIEPRLRLTGPGLSGGVDMSGMPLPGYAFLDERVEKVGVALITLAGEARFGFSMANGMQPVGPGAFVTDAQGPVIKTLNGRPAKDVVLELLVGNETEEVRTLFAKNPTVMGVERGITLATQDPEGDFYWCHMPITFLPDGSFIDFFEAKRGSGLSLVRIDKQSCLDAVEQAAGMLVEDVGKPELEGILAFSCSLRGFTLGGETAHEDGKLRKAVKVRKLLGVVANGEVGCYRAGRPLHTGWVYALFGLAQS